MHAAARRYVEARLLGAPAALAAEPVAGSGGLIRAAYDAERHGEQLLDVERAASML